MHPEYDIPVKGGNIYETTSQTGAGGVTNFNDGVTFPFIEEYVDEYAADSFNVDSPDGSPMYMGFGTYDAVLLLQQVLNEVGTTDPADNLDDYVDAMLSAEFEGALGTIEFYEQDAEFPHDLVAERNSNDRITNFPVTQWQPNDGDTSPAHVEYGEQRPGKVECVFPEQYRTSDHVMPAWMA
jgi:branched-chain amino acid transport system substrate-binding protein